MADRIQRWTRKYIPRVAKFAADLVGRDLLQGRVVQDQRATLESRTYWGRTLDTRRIEQTIVSANGGFMRPMTDMGAESMMLDGHLSAVVTKRLNRITALPFEIVPATGEDINTDLAGELASLVSHQLRQFDFRAHLQDLAWGLWDGRSCNENEFALTSIGGKLRYAIVEQWWIHPRRLSLGPTRDLRIVRTDAELGNFQDLGLPVASIPFKFCSFMPRLFNDYAEREGLSPRCLYWSFFGRFGTRERLILVELFGKPWRIIELDPEMNHNPDALEDADEAVDSLGASSTARVPPGVHVNVTSPQGTAGQVHRELIKDAKEELSKLVLGVTGTTDAQPTGMNSNMANVHADEQWLVVQGDVRRVSYAVTRGTIWPIVWANYGPEALSHAPMLIIRAEPPPDVEEELKRIDMATKGGMRVSLEEVHQRTGYRRPKEDEVVLEVVTDANAELSGAPPRARIVYPQGEAPPPGVVPGVPPVELPTTGLAKESEHQMLDVSVTPTDVAKVHSVNEIRALAGSEPLKLPDGSADPDGFLPMPLYEAKLAAQGAEYGKAAGQQQAKDEGIEIPKPTPPAGFPGPGSAPPTTPPATPPASPSGPAQAPPTPAKPPPGTTADAPKPPKPGPAPTS